MRLSEEELNNFEGELSSILDYVGAVTKIAGDEADAVPQVGSRYNVFRTDEITNEPDQYTDAILAEMPKTSGRFLSVKKILQIDE